MELGLTCAPTDLTSSRLILRRFKEDDLDEFELMNQDPQVMEFMLNKTLSRAECLAWIQRIQENFNSFQYGLWAMELKETRQFIGFCGLWPAPSAVPFEPKIEIGWRMKRHAWGNGYVTEAANIALKDAFSRGLKEVCTFTSLLNLRSIAVMERLGFKRDFQSDFAHPKIPADHPLSRHVLYRLTYNDACKNGLISIA